MVHSTPETDNVDRNVPREFQNYVRGNSVKKNLNKKFDSVDSKQGDEGGALSLTSNGGTSVQVSAGLISDGSSSQSGLLSRSLSPILSTDRSSSSPSTSLQTPYTDTSASNANGDGGANGNAELTRKLKKTHIKTTLLY